MSDILKRLDSLLTIEAFDAPTIRAARAEIAKLRADLELDMEFAHAPDCTGRGISRMCVGCIEAGELRQQDKIDRLTAIVDQLSTTADHKPVVRGMKVFRRTPSGEIQGYDVGVNSACDDSSCPNSAYLVYPLCYSSREALEAAEAKKVVEDE